MEIREGDCFVNTSGSYFMFDKKGMLAVYGGILSEEIDYTKNIDLNKKVGDDMSFLLSHSLWDYLGNMTDGE